MKPRNPAFQDIFSVIMLTVYLILRREVFTDVFQAFRGPRSVVQNNCHDFQVKQRRSAQITDQHEQEFSVTRIQQIR